MVSTFCGMLTLQVGVTVLAAVFFTLGAVVFVANVIEELGEDGGDVKKGEQSAMSWSIIFIIVFSIMMFIIGGLKFCSAYNENRGLAMIGLLVLLLLTTFWIILSMLSFFGKRPMVESVCYKTRCPETLWLASNLHYRNEEGRRAKRGYHLDSMNRESESKEQTFQQPSLNIEIQQILDELRKLDSCLKSCCKDECVKMRGGQNHRYCNLDVLTTIDKHMAGLVESKNLSEGESIFKRGINGTDNIKLSMLQEYSTELTSNFDNQQIVSPSVLPVDITALQGNLKVRKYKESPRFYRNDNANNDATTRAKIKANNDATTRAKNKANDDATTTEPSVAEIILAALKKQEGSKFKFGLPLIASVILFAANLLFFIFSMCTLWSWLQELGDDCGYDDFYYYY